MAEVVEEDVPHVRRLASDAITAGDRCGSISTIFFGSTCLTLGGSVLDYPRMKGSKGFGFAVIECSADCIR